MRSAEMQPGEVLDFWFSDRVQMLCFERDDAFDAEIRTRFGAAVAEAQGGGMERKRPPVETEGRLTIACHMKILQKIDIVKLAKPQSIITIPFSRHKFKLSSTSKKQPDNIKKLNC